MPPNKCPELIKGENDPNPGLNCQDGQRNTPQIPFNRTIAS